MNLDNIPDYLKLIIGIISGGGIAQLFNVLVSRSEVRIAGAKELRETLVTETDELRSMNRNMQSELDEWKHKYYAELEEKIVIRATNQKLEAEVRELLDKVEVLNREVMNLRADLSRYQNANRGDHERP